MENRYDVEVCYDCFMDGYWAVIRDRKTRKILFTTGVECSGKFARQEAQLWIEQQS